MTVLAHSVGETGGMERAQRLVVTGLLNRGWRVRVLAWHCDLAPRPHLEFVRLPVPRRPFLVEHTAYAVAAATVLAKRPEPGLISSLGANVLRGVDVITLQYVHHAPSSSRPRRAGSGPRVAAAEAYQAAARRLALAFETFCYQPGRVRQVVAVSERLRDEVLAAFPALAGQVTVVPNGADITRFAPDLEARRAVRRLVGFSDDELVAVFVGGDWERKGLHVAVDTLAEAPGWSLLVVGRGDQVAYRALARSRGIDDSRVRFVGPVRDPERYLAASDVFIMPTLYEGFPLASIEAASSGLPLLMTPEANADRVLADAVTGYVLPRDPRAFAERLRGLGSDRERRLAFGRAACMQAATLSWDGIVDEHDAIYRRLLSERRPRSFADGENVAD